ncbi:MAG: stage III sporulation protein AB [Eubacteriaceae bacterium]|nr:stage III sporulation protein AB [Eubacteriaceae bacterium]
MVRFISFIIIVLSSYGIGALASQSYKSRYREINVFRAIVSDMINTVRHSPLSLEDICRQYESENFYPFSEAFRLLRTSIKGSSLPSGELWAKEAAKLALSSKPAHKELYESAISAFALPDKGRVEASLSLIEARLAAEAATAKEEISSKGALAQKLAIACGLFAVVLLW